MYIVCIPVCVCYVYITVFYCVYVCRTSEDELRKFLQDEVLSKYVYLYNQQGDDMAPDGKTSLRSWVGKMLNEMQESIESHINNAMKGSGGGSSSSGGAPPSGMVRSNSNRGSGSDRE